MTRLTIAIVITAALGQLGALGPGLLTGGGVGVRAQPRVAGGGPGAKATWTNGNKQGIGTATAPVSRVWFTLGDGVLTETYYPTVDKSNLRILEFVVTDGAGFFERA